MAISTLKNLSSKDSISAALVALKDACEDGKFDASNLDLSELSAKDAGAVRAFTKSLKRGSSWDKVKGAFKAFCLGGPVRLTDKHGSVEREVPKSAKVAKAVNKEHKQSREESKAVVNPIVHDGIGDVEVNLRQGTATLFDHPLVTFKYELLKRRECYEINFKWVTVKGHRLTDKVMLPHKTVPTESALKLWIGKIVRRLVLVYLSPYLAMKHPADSQGIINEERTW